MVVSSVAHVGTKGQCPVPPPPLPPRQARGSSKDSTEVPFRRKSTRKSSSSCADTPAPGVLGSSASVQENGAQQEHESSCASETASSDLSAQVRKSDSLSSDTSAQVRRSDSLSRKLRPVRGRRAPPGGPPRRRVRRVSRNSNANRTSRSQSRSDPESHCARGGDSGKSSGLLAGPANGEDAVDRRVEYPVDSTTVDSAASGSSLLEAETAQGAEIPAAVGVETESLPTKEATDVASSLCAPGPLAFSDAIDPFPSYDVPKSRSASCLGFSFSFLFEKGKASWGSSSLPSSFSSSLAFLKARALRTPPAVTAAVALLVLLTCLPISLRLLLVWTPVRQASVRLFTRPAYDGSQARSSAVHYCQQSRSRKDNSLLHVVDELPLLPFPTEDFSRDARRHRDRTTCHPCPEHAVCAGGRMKCLPPYLRVPAAAVAERKNFFTAVMDVTQKLFRKNVDEGDVCVENLVARRAAEGVVERIVLLLRRRAGDIQCGSLKVCHKLSHDGRRCVSTADSRKHEATREEKPRGRHVSSPADASMTRWELLQSEELREQLEDDSVYVYVFDRLLEEKAALQLDIEVKQQYSFESMRLPRQDHATSSSSSSFSDGGVVALFLREQRRSQGITYSYEYIGAYAARSVFCTFRLIFTSMLFPFSVVILALSVCAFPVAVWLRRFYLRQQLLLLMQQQQGEQQALVESRTSGASPAAPLVYCGCSSAHLSQLLLRQTALHRFSLLRWWLQRTATKIEEVDAMCFELLHDKSTSVQRVSHEDENYWWVRKKVGSTNQQAADNSRTNTRCSSPDSYGLTPRPSTPLPHDSSTSCAGFGFLNARQRPSEALPSSRLSRPFGMSSACPSLPRDDTHAISPCSLGCDPDHKCGSSDGTGDVQHVDPCGSAMHSKEWHSGCGFAASGSNGSTSTAAAIARLLPHAGGVSQRSSCFESNTGHCGLHAFSSHPADSHPAGGHAAGSGCTVVDRVCHRHSSCCSHGSELGPPCCDSRTSTPVPDCTFSDFLSRGCRLHQRTSGHDYSHLHGGSPLPAATVGCGRSSVL